MVMYRAHALAVCCPSNADVAILQALIRLDNFGSAS